MPKSDILNQSKKRRRLTKSTINVLIQSKFAIDIEKLGVVINDFYDSCLQVNKAKRPNEQLAGNIKSLDANLEEIDDNQILLKINVATYTLLQFDYALFNKALSKTLKLPVGSIKAVPAPKILPTPTEVVKEEEPKEPPPEVIEAINAQIDNQIESDILPPISIPENYVQPVAEMEKEYEELPAIPQGKSDIPSMPELDKDSKSDYSYFQPLLIGFAAVAAMVGLKSTSAPPPSTSRFGYLN